MPITQIPFQDPVAPSEKPQPEQLGLYDTRDWETAYRDLDAHVPHLLIQLQDDLQRSRWREALWISIIVHLLLTFTLLKFTWVQNFVGWHPATTTSDATKNRILTVLALPTDVQKPTTKPNTPVASDKNRVAMTRHPELEPKEPRRTLPSPPPGTPGLNGLRSPQPSVPQPAMPQNQATAEQPQATQRPKFESNQTAQLQAPASPKNSFSKYAGGMSAGSAIQQATQAAAATRGQGGQGGDFGLGTGARGRPQGNLEILSDTLGVDFAPYMERLRIIIYRHWYEVLPESVMPPTYKKGKLAINFAILEDGRVVDMKLATSGDTALDRAAWGGITGSNPFPPLPPEFIKSGGKYLSLRCIFVYNPDERDLQ